MAGEAQAATPPATQPPQSLDPAVGAIDSAPGSGDGPVLSRWQLVALASDGSEVRRFDLKEGDNLVGSESAGEGIHPDVDLGPLDPSKNVSRRHALISVQGDQVFLADHSGSANRGSRNGTWVGGARITCIPVELTERSDIAFGQLRFRVITRAARQHG